MVTIIVGPTSVGKSHYCDKLKKNNINVIDANKHNLYKFGKERNELQKKYMEQLKKKGEKFSALKFKRYLDNHVEFFIAHNALSKTKNGKKVILPHIKVPKQWKELLDPKIIILFRPIKDAIYMSMLRKVGNRRSTTQVINDYMRLFKKTEKCINDKLKLEYLKGNDKYNKYFGLTEKKRTVCIEPRIEYSKIIILDFDKNIKSNSKDK